jgi:hypothetical protein
MTVARLLHLLLSAGIAATAQRQDRSELERIEETRRVLREFNNDLPNFTCEQLTRRFHGTGKVLDWRPLDQIAADMVYLHGEEYATNMRINNQPRDQGAITKGAWSGGDFGLVQFHVFAKETHARFRFVKNTSHAGRPALRFAYTVIQEASEWEVEYAGERIKPAYEGHIWIDAETSRPLRIEMQARDIPVSYPLKLIERTVDYGVVNIAGRGLLLPVRATNIVCHRKFTACARNETDFRNYRQFTAESVVTTTDSTVTFEPPEKPPSTPRPKQ